MRKKGKAVVVTTAHRGVFFGYEESTEGNTITLTRARNCLYWVAEVKGFVGLATTGPVDGCRIGPAVSRLKLFDVTSVLDASEQAVALWEKTTW